MGRLWRALVLCLAGFGLLVAGVTFTPFVEWYGGKLAGRWADPEGDILIVLTGAAEDPGLLGHSSYLRALYAVRVYRQSPFREVVVSGRAAAEEMRQFLVCSGVPEQAIRLETESHTTRESALNVAAMLQHRPGRKVLLTSDYHMRRAHAAFTRAGLTVTPRPFPDARKRAALLRLRWSAFLDEAYESTAIVYYQWKGWI